MLDVLILMAGRGTRFRDEYPDTPKPLVPLHGVPLVRWVVENLRFQPDQRYIFLALEEHVQKFDLFSLFSSWNLNFEIVVVKEVTEGAACTALLAAHLFQDHELIIANSDQYIQFDHDQFLREARQVDGLIMTMNAHGNKWSYVKEENGLISKVAEKVQISDQGTTGIYYFRKGSMFTEAAMDMIRENDRYNNEFYLAPSYNYMIRNHRRIKAFPIGEIGKEMIGLGTSQDFSQFEKLSLSLELKKKIFPMIKYKAVIFDLDGVLTSTRELHYKALAMALQDAGLTLSAQEHERRFDGLPTFKKIEILAKEHSFSPETVNFINSRKQIYTIEFLENEKLTNVEHARIFSWLLRRNVPMAICSNTKRVTLDFIINKLEIMKYLNFTLSNDDVINPKPSPEMYQRAAALLKLDPQDIVAFEDSVHGIEAARMAGVAVVPVKQVDQLTLEWVIEKIT